MFTKKIFLTLITVACAFVTITGYAQIIITAPNLPTQVVSGRAALAFYTVTNTADPIQTLEVAYNIGGLQPIDPGPGFPAACVFNAPFDAGAQCTVMFSVTSNINGNFTVCGGGNCQTSSTLNVTQVANDAGLPMLSATGPITLVAGGPAVTLQVRNPIDGTFANNIQATVQPPAGGPANPVTVSYDNNCKALAANQICTITFTAVTGAPIGSGTVTLFAANTGSLPLRLQITSNSSPIPVFTVTKKAGFTLPTEIVSSHTAVALYTVTNNSSANSLSGLASTLPNNVSQVTTDANYPNLCGSSFTLAQGQSCTLKLAINAATTGAINVITNAGNASQADVPLNLTTVTGYDYLQLSAQSLAFNATTPTQTLTVTYTGNPAGADNAANNIVLIIPPTSPLANYIEVARPVTCDSLQGANATCTLQLAAQAFPASTISDTVYVQAAASTTASRPIIITVQPGPMVGNELTVAGWDIHAGSQSSFLSHSLDNGQTWADISPDVPTTPAPYKLKSIASDGNKFVAVGQGLIYYRNITDLTWRAAANIPAQNWNSVAVNESGNWVAVGEAGAVLTSNNGINWSTAINSGTPYTLTSVTWNRTAQRWIAVGNYGAIVTNDTRNATGVWTARSGSNLLLMGVACSDVICTAVGATDDTGSSTILTSTNGLTWQKQTNLGREPLHAVAYGNTQWIAVGSHQNILASTNANATNWTITHAGDSTKYPLWGLTFNGTRWVVVGMRGMIFTSTYGISWLQQISGTVEHLTAIASITNTKSRQ